MGSIGWRFSSADVGVFTNHQSEEDVVGVENLQPLRRSSRSWGF
jgi:hypothetical protein